jgi:hypothetical protein
MSGGSASAMQAMSDLRGRWKDEGVLRPKREAAAVKLLLLLLLLPTLRSYGLRTNSKADSTCATHGFKRQEAAGEMEKRF